MAIAPYNDLKGLDDSQLEQEILVTKKELFTLRLQKATRQSFKPHLVRQLKRKIAQLLTLEHERKHNLK